MVLVANNPLRRVFYRLLKVSDIAWPRITLVSPNVVGTNVLIQPDVDGMRALHPRPISWRINRGGVSDERSRDDRAAICI